MAEKSNAKKFIASYNAIDRSLRAQYNIKRSLTFSDVIRKTAVCNSIVRKYEDDLVDYSRLRNAIVHGGDDENPIAEPNDEVVRRLETIEKLITTPPKALDSICRRDVFIIPPTYTIKDAICRIAESGYSNIPVYDGEELLGIINGQKIINYVGEAILKGYDVNQFISQTSVVDVLKSMSFEKYYALASRDLTLDQVLDMFYGNRKLLVILITNNGTSTEPPLGVITGSDIMDINNIMDNFNGDYNEERTSNS